MNERLCEILNKCFEISTNTKADVFFEYAPHVNSYSVYVYRDGWTEETFRDMEWLACSKKVSEENLTFTMTELDILECELGVA